MVKTTDGKETLHDPILAWFNMGNTDKLPAIMASMLRHYQALARSLCERLQRGAEREVALRKLLESRDAAFRSMIEGLGRPAPQPDDGEKADVAEAGA